MRGPQLGGPDKLETHSGPIPHPPLLEAPPHLFSELTRMWYQRDGLAYGHMKDQSYPSMREKMSEMHQIKVIYIDTTINITSEQ